jgi:hypothetical protein
MAEIADVPFYISESAALSVNALCDEAALLHREDVFEGESPRRAKLTLSWPSTGTGQQRLSQWRSEDTTVGRGHGVRLK